MTIHMQLADLIAAYQTHYALTRTGAIRSIIRDLLGLLESYEKQEKEGQ